MNNKHVVTYLLTFTAVKLLASAPANSPVKKLAQSAYNQMRARYSDNDVKGVEMIAKILTSLVGQLSRCEDVSQLEVAVSYVEALEKNEVLIANQDKFLTQTGEEYVAQPEQ